MKAIVDALVQVTLYSAAVTAGILLFRFIFKNRISSKLQYLMWWLLILRLRCLLSGRQRLRERTDFREMEGRPLSALLSTHAEDRSMV